VNCRWAIEHRAAHRQQQAGETQATETPATEVVKREAWQQMGARQSAASDEARDTARLANASIDGPINWPAHASFDMALNFTSLTLTKRPMRGSSRQAVGKRKTLQTHSAIQIDRAAKCHFDTLLFELAKHVDDTRSTRFTRSVTHSPLNKVLYERSNANRKQDFSRTKSFIAREKMVQTVLN
jgi:hypothetical protein